MQTAEAERLQMEAERAADEEMLDEELLLDPEAEPSKANRELSQPPSRIPLDVTIPSSSTAGSSSTSSS